jgi:hypothetical protein
MRVWLWIGLTVAGFAFLTLTHRATRRVRRVRRELRRMQYLHAVERAYECERVADERILGIG